MSVFLTASGNTLRKIWGHRKYQVFMTIVCLLSAFFSIYSRGGMRFSIGAISFSFSNGANLALSALSNIFLPLLAFMLCSDLYAHELSDNTIKVEFLRPIGRTKLYYAKFTGILAYCGLILLSSYIICVVIGIMNGSVSNVLQLFLANILSLISCGVFIAFAGMFAVWSGNPSLTMFLSILLYIVALIAVNANSTFGAIFFTGYNGWYKMVLGSVVQWKNLFISFLLLLSYTALFSSIGQLLFSQKNIS